MLVVLSILSAAAAAAETTLSVSPLGVLGFTLHNVGDYAINVEHVRGRHGAMIEASGIHVHGDPTHTTLIGGGVGYRFHLEGGAFFGAIAGTKRGFAKYYYDHEADNHDDHWRYEVQQRSLIPHLGYRWEVGERLRISARLGVGWAQHAVSTDVTAEGIDAATTLLEDRLQFSPVKIDSELSAGFRF